MAKKTKDLKVTDTELKSLQTKVQIINQAQMQVGGLEVQKSMLMEQVRAYQAELTVTQKELEEKYGKVSVNLTDGTITEIPEENETDKKD